MDEIDWSIVPKRIRTPHFHNECYCRRYFPSGADPPPWYVLRGEYQTEEKWDFLQSDRILRPTDPDEGKCVWIWYAADPINGWQRQIALTLKQSESFPLWIEMKLEVSSQDGVAINSFENLASSPTSEIADPLDRSQSYSWDPFFWVDQYPGSGGTPPIGTIRLEPLPCIPGWRWGQPIPTWDYTPP